MAMASLAAGSPGRKRPPCVQKRRSGSPHCDENAGIRIPGWRRRTANGGYSVCIYQQRSDQWLRPVDPRVRAHDEGPRRYRSG